MGRLPEDAIGVELDGENVSPSTVEALPTLRIALSFLELIKAIADDLEEPLVMSGVEVRDKCAAVFTIVDKPEVGRHCATRAVRMVGGVEHPRRGFMGHVKAIQDAHASLPAGHTVSALAAGVRFPIEPGSFAHGQPYAAIGVRAEVMRVGGREPTATFRSASEPRSFVLSVPREMARELARHLYDEVDIEAIVARDEDGVIEEGELSAFHPLEDVDPLEAWSSFFRDGLSYRKH